MGKTIKDFYTRVPGDPKRQENVYETSDDIEAMIGQIRMTLLTEKGEVLGEPDFGVDINKYLFEFDIDPFTLSNDALEQITTYVSGSAKRKIDVNPAKYSEPKHRDVFVLHVNIKGETELAIFYD
jgi:hypothetical protein